MKHVNFKALYLTLMITACGDSSGPGGLDPIVLATNDQGTYLPVVITWWDQSGQALETTVPSFTQRCIKFTSTTPTDSVRYEVVVGDTTGANGPWSKQWSPWFDPRTGIPTANASAYPHGAEFWTVVVNDQTGSGAVMQAVEKAPC